MSEVGVWRRRQWILIAMAALFLSGLALFEEHADTKSDKKAIQIVTILAGYMAQACWVSFDCRHLGRPTRFWPLLGALCGPIGIWVYLIAAYRGRALYLIPLSVAVYTLVFVVALLMFIASSWLLYWL